MATNYQALLEEEIEALRSGALGQEVPVAEVGTYLRELWEGDENRTRASLVNLVIYSEQLGALIENSALLSEITGDHACRALLVMSLTAQEPNLRAWITAHCHLSNGKKTVCSEQVAFLLEGASPSTVHNIVFSNLDSDLPLVFWWQGDFSDKFDDRLYSVIDRLVFDSETWADPARELGRLAAAEAEASSRFVVSDLAWARCHAMRAALATRFELPAARAVLGELDELRIEAPEGSTVQNVLLVAWIAYSLGASPQSSRGDGETWLLRRSEGTDIRVKLSTADQPDGGSLQLCGPTSSFKVTRVEDLLCAETETPNCQSRQLLPGGPMDESALMRTLLQRTGDRSLYGRLVPMVREML